MTKQTLEDNRQAFELLLGELTLASVIRIEYDYVGLKKPLSVRLSLKKINGIISRVYYRTNEMPIASHVANYLPSCKDLTNAMVLAYLRIPIQAHSNYSQARLIWES